MSFLHTNVCHQLLLRQCTHVICRLPSIGEERVDIRREIMGIEQLEQSSVRV
jgi:hypothetical protein